MDTYTILVFYYKQTHIQVDLISREHVCHGFNDLLLYDGSSTTWYSRPRLLHSLLF